MTCTNCGKVISQNEMFCKHCGEKNNSYVEREINNNNVDTKSFTFGVISLVIAVIGFVIFGFLEFIALGLSIAGLILENQNKKNGYPNSTALTLNIIALVVSIIGSLLMINYYMFMFS